MACEKQNGGRFTANVVLKFSEEIVAMHILHFTHLFSTKLQ